LLGAFFLKKDREKKIINCIPVLLDLMTMTGVLKYLILIIPGVYTFSTRSILIHPVTFHTRVYTRVFGVPVTKGTFSGGFATIPADHLVSLMI
jgi:hypothetical protein